MLVETLGCFLMYKYLMRKPAKQCCDIISTAHRLIVNNYHLVALNVISQHFAILTNNKKITFEEKESKTSAITCRALFFYCLTNILCLFLALTTEWYQVLYWLALEWNLTPWWWSTAIKTCMIMMNLFSFVTLSLSVVVAELVGWLVVFTPWWLWGGLMIDYYCWC